MPIYTQAQLKSDVNGKIKGKIGILIDFQSTLNQAVREVLSQIDMVSMRRRTALVPNLYSGLFQYAAPTDLKGYAVITIQNQTNSLARDWSLVPYEQFMRRQDGNTIAISSYDGLTKIFLNTTNKSYYYNYDYNSSDPLLTPNVKTTFAALDTLSSGGGTWGPFGDVTAGAVYKDTSNFVEGSGSIRFNINAAAGVTAGIVNSTLNSSDISDFFLQNGNAYVWAYITSVTNLTNFILRLGSSATVYNTMTATTQADGTAFVAGWNLIAFDLSAAVLTGVPVNTAITYCALYMTKTAAKVSENAYRFDFLVLRRGQINNLYYYSKYGWQSSAGAYKENSTAASDYLNVDTDEYNLILLKATEYAAEEVDEEIGGIKVYRGKIFFNPRYEKFNQLKKDYVKTHPSEALTMISTTKDFVKL